MPDNPIYFFEFEGRAQTDQFEKEPFDEELVFFLNDNTFQISEEIRQGMRQMLPPFVEVQVELNFYQGSISWTGIIIILDWMARLGGAAELVVMLSTVIRIVVKAVIQRWIRRANQGRAQRMSITVNVNAQPPRESRELRKSFDPLFLIIVFTLVNTILLAFVVWAEYFLK
jgi:hypothetical protein